MSINVKLITYQIMKSALSNNNIQDDKCDFLINELRVKLREIERKHTKDGLALIQLYKVLKTMHLNPQGYDNSQSFYGKFTANNITHKIGFIEYKNGIVCLAVKGGGWDGDDSLLFLRDGKNTEVSDEYCNVIFDGYKAEHIIQMPLGRVLWHKNSLITTKMTVDWLWHFHHRVDTFLKDFEAFRDEYLEYINSIVDHSESCL